MRYHKDLEEVKVTYFTEEEPRAYDKSLDLVHTEKPFSMTARRRAVQKAVLRVERRVSWNSSLKSARLMLAGGFPEDDVVRFTGLGLQQVKQLVLEKK